MKYHDTIRVDLRDDVNKVGQENSFVAGRVRVNEWPRSNAFGW
jgi:hypothetical protein